MFTGLIESIGTIRQIRPGNRTVSLTVSPLKSPYDTAVGSSIAVDGVCLTVESVRGGDIEFTAVRETLSRTTLNRVRPGTEVNLERAMRLSDRLEGHIVLGHVDAVGCITGRRREGDALLWTISAPGHLSPFIAEKGSIAVDGVSLTVVTAGTDSFVVTLVPHTADVTNVHRKGPGHGVNLECDILARYIFHQIGRDATDGAQQAPEKEKSSRTSLLDSLHRAGF
jgi:riboflavin synthase